MSDDFRSEESKLMEDLGAFRGLLTNLASTPAQSQADLDAAYASLRPAMVRLAGEEAVPEKYEPGFVEAGMVFTNNMQARVEDYRGFHAVDAPSLDEGNRAGMPFDETNPIDAQFLDANGVPSFNNSNYKDFLKTRGISDSFIQELEKSSENDLLSLMDNMTPEQQVSVVNTLATVSAGIDKARAAQKDPRRLTETARGDLTKEIVKSEEQIGRLNDIRGSYKEDYLTWGSRGAASFDKALEKSGLASDEKKKLIKEREIFMKDVNQLFNVYVKEFAGSAAAKEEVGRQEKAIINGKMSPTEFEATIDVMQKNMQTAVDYRLAMLDQGRVLTKSEAMQELEEAGKLKPIPGSQAEKTGQFGGLRPQEIISKAAAANASGLLDDNTLLAAAKSYAAATGKDWDSQPDKVKAEAIEVLRRMIGAR